MSKLATLEYLVHARKRYHLLRGKKAKSRLLDELQEATGYSRKQLIRKLKEPASLHKEKVGGGRPPLLTQQDQLIIREIWLKSEQPCGKRLAPLLEDWLPSWEKQNGSLPSLQRKRILQSSASTLGRLLKRSKTALIRKNGQTQLSYIKSQIPTRQHIWQVKECGWLEADTVAHCGSSMKGSFAWSLTVTDIQSGWPFIRSIWNKGEQAVLNAFDHIISTLPFDLKGIDTDNGSEFINYHLFRYWKNHPSAPELSRSRPYCKNDNAHVEQKNKTHVRDLIGYERLGDEQHVELLNNIYEIWNKLRNHFIPCMKLMSRKRVGNKVIKNYAPAKTPYARVMESRITLKKKKQLEEEHHRLDPLTLRELLEEHLKILFEAIRQHQANNHEH